VARILNLANLSPNKLEAPLGVRNVPIASHPRVTEPDYERRMNHIGTYVLASVATVLVGVVALRIYV
jgi:hypothetical protein